MCLLSTEISPKPSTTELVGIKCVIPQSIVKMPELINKDLIFIFNRVRGFNNYCINALVYHLIIKLHAIVDICKSERD